MSIFLFESIHLVIKAEKLLRKENIACEIIPVPRDISAECGMAIRMNDAQKKEAIKALQSENIKYRLITKRQKDEI